MTTATQRLQAIQDECKRQGKPTHGTAFLRVAERMNEALRGTGTPAYQQVREIIERGKEYINATKP
jgi:hypothetical protein